MAFSHLYLLLLDKANEAVQGDTLTAKYKNQIECADWRWQVRTKEDARTTGHRATGAGSRVEPTVLCFSKPPDRSSTRMMTALDTGELFPKATFTLYEELAGDRKDTLGSFNLRIMLTEVRVIKYNLCASSDPNEVTLSEDWEFDYQEITFEFNMQGNQKVSVQRRPNSSYEPPEANKVEKLMQKVADLDSFELNKFREHLTLLDLPAPKTEE